MHGYGGDAPGQMSYTQMNQYAHDQGMAVVYPQGLNNSWNVYTYWDNNSYDDVSFISDMVDQIAIDFNIDLDRVYACGMSNGGYMTYRLACDLSGKIAAFGSVTGNFMLTTSIGDCVNQDRDIPIIHFHGTSDQVVNYYPPSFDQSLTVSESIDFWSSHNNLTAESVESINTNVEVYTYSKESSATKFVHYKIYGGNHEWFGSNWGFQASNELINFFLEYRLSDFNQLAGDFNSDDYIDILDVIILVNHILSPAAVELDGADINEDSNVDILDIITLVNIILNQ
jgi:polyhydroxybutyrate depolymerase